jgi:hypothetical protein
MTTISTPANPQSFGFETGVIPDGTSNNFAAPGYILSVVDVATLPFPTGPTSPRALQFQYPFNSSLNGYWYIALEVTQGDVFSCKVASSLDSTDSVSVFTPDGTAHNIYGTNGWQTLTWTADHTGTVYFEVDIHKNPGPGDDVNAAWITDISVNGQGHLTLGATTGEAYVPPSTGGGGGTGGGGDTGDGGDTGTGGGGSYTPPPPPPPPTHAATVDVLVGTAEEHFTDTSLYTLNEKYTGTRIQIRGGEDNRYVKTQQYNSFGNGLADQNAINFDVAPGEVAEVSFWAQSQAKGYAQITWAAGLDNAEAEVNLLVDGVQVDNAQVSNFNGNYHNSQTPSFGDDRLHYITLQIIAYSKTGYTSFSVGGVRVVWTGSYDSGWNTLPLPFNGFGYSPAYTLTFEDSQDPAGSQGQGQRYYLNASDWGAGATGNIAQVVYVNDAAQGGNQGTAIDSFSNGIPSWLTQADNTDGAGISVIDYSQTSYGDTLGQPVTDNTVVLFDGRGNNGAVMQLNTNATWLQDGVIGFDYALESEQNYDMIRVYVDGQIMWQNSGLQQWTHQEVPVAAGYHEVVLSYEKDGSDSVGLDLLVLDNFALTNVDMDSLAQGPGSGPQPAIGSYGDIGWPLVSSGDLVADVYVSWGLQDDGIGRIRLGQASVVHVVGAQVTRNQYTHYQIPVPAGIHLLTIEVQGGPRGGQNVAAIDSVQLTGLAQSAYSPGYGSPQAVESIATGTTHVSIKLRGKVYNSEQPVPDVSATGTTRVLAVTFGHGETVISTPDVSATGTTRVTITTSSGFYVEIDVLDDADDAIDPEDDPNSPDVVPDV